MRISVKEVCEKFGFKPVAGLSALGNVISDVYIGDLLSWVMGKAKENSAWITIQSHINIVAVALLINSACIIVCEDSPVDPAAIEKADDEGVPIITTSMNAYEVAKIFGKME